LKNCGVDVSLVKVSKKASTSTSILFINDKKERSYFHLVGASKEIEVNKRELDKIFKSKIFHVGGVNLLPGLDGKPLAEVLRKVKSKNVITSVDLAWDVKNRWMKNLKHSLPFIDILMANEDEIKALTEEKNLKRAINFLHRAGLKIVVVKLGKDGSIVSKNFDFEYVPPFKVKSKDSTGAGDAFAGGFLYGLLKSKSLFESALIGNYVGALATTKVGSTSAFFNLTEKEIDKILSRTKL
jgi:sugar/nucleoside kinase (ribokinase family)